MIYTLITGAPFAVAIPDGLSPGQQFIVHIPSAGANERAGGGRRGQNTGTRTENNREDGERNPRRGFGADLERARSERRQQRRERVMAEMNREEEELQMVLSMSAETAFFEQIKREDDETTDGGAPDADDGADGKPIDLSNAKVLRECEVCLDDIVVGHRLRTLPCMHIFHAKCANDWLRYDALCFSLSRFSQ